MDKKETSKETTVTFSERMERVEFYISELYYAIKNFESKEESVFESKVDITYTVQEMLYKLQNELEVLGYEISKQQIYLENLEENEGGSNNENSYKNFI